MAETDIPKHARQRFGFPYLAGWAEIAKVLGKPESTARAYSQLDIDPLPVQREDISGRVWIYVYALEAWAMRRGLHVLASASGR